MGLCSAAFDVIYPGNTFTLEGFIVCRCNRMEQAAVGEVLFSTLAGPYTTFGTGFLTMVRDCLTIAQSKFGIWIGGGCRVL